MFNYLSNFSTRLSELSESIRELSKERVPFNWGLEHWPSFQCNKKGNSKSTNSSILWPQKRKILQTDASIKGLGACLLQQGKPGYFTSKALREAQKGYVVIELESLAVVWAMEKFHLFLYGTHLHIGNWPKTVRSNPVEEFKPSYTMFAKNSYLNIPYHFTVCHLPGPMNQLANCLSRLGSQNDDIKLPNLHIHQSISQLKARSDSLNQLHAATQEDDELVLLKHTITNGWPNSIKEVPHEVQAYWTFHEELTIKDRLVLKGTRIVIPKSKHKQVLTMIHKRSLGSRKV